MQAPRPLSGSDWPGHAEEKTLTQGRWDSARRVAPAVPPLSTEILTVSLKLYFVPNTRSTRDSVLQTLERSRALLRDALDNVGVQNNVLSAAEERSKIASAQFSIGTTTYDNWTIIEDNLVNAKRTYLNAQAAALAAEADWIQAKGETLEYEY
jgi:Asp/Glu/hydantoin racemase